MDDEEGEEVEECGESPAMDLASCILLENLLLDLPAVGILGRQVRGTLQGFHLLLTTLSSAAPLAPGSRTGGSEGRHRRCSPAVG